VTEEVAEPRTDVAPVRVATSPQTWAGHDALRHASIEPGVALIQVATAQRHGEIPGAFELPVFDVVSDDHRVDGEALTRLLGDAGLLAEDQMIVVGRGFEDGALAWFLLDRVADLPAVRLYPGGMERYRRVALLPLHEQVEEPAEAPATGGSQLDDREVDG
jgi:3-mercaptopyruvate sulfurtransferase SseA